MPTIVQCPVCGIPVEWTAEHRWRPFCSERCRLIDLGAWVSEEHRIAGEEEPDETPSKPSEPGEDDS